MPYQNFLDYALSPVFLIMFGLTLATFLPLLYSVWVTWRDNSGDPDEE